MKHILVPAAFVLLLANPALADKGPVIWQDDVSLAQDSQKLIIVHNGPDQKRSMALVWVDHVAGPRSGAAYYITLRKKNGAWAIANSVMVAIH